MISPRFWFLLLCLLPGARVALAHPMGNFSINHFARFEAKSDFLSLRTVLDFAEIPTSERMPQLDPNGDQIISEPEKRAFLRRQLPNYARNYVVQIGGKPAALKPQSSKLELRAGAGGLQTLRVTADWRIDWPVAGTRRVSFADTNFEGRNGWMEIVARAAAPQKIVDSDAAATSISRELTTFPSSDAVVAPRQRSASFSVVPVGTGDVRASTSNAPETANIASAANASAANASAANASAANASAANTQTPQNRFTQSIAERELTPGLVFGGLLAALAFGAVHALSPGHGKTMVAAYLVGSRGTPRHAVTLGLVVTITHTLGVFALGFALLFASRYVLPEKLFPVLSALSGLLIFGVGLWLFMSRYQDLQRGDSYPHAHEHSHSEHSHSEHSHSEHSHAYGSHTHSHGGRAHSHAVPDGPITLKTLLALGISGGIVPCPEALVVLLAAVKLHRIGYGMLLITAFSMGLAAALIAIGLVVVAARDRFSTVGSGGVLTRYLPLGSAAAITVIGIILTLQATAVSGP